MFMLDVDEFCQIRCVRDSTAPPFQSVLWLILCSFSVNRTRKESATMSSPIRCISTVSSIITQPINQSSFPPLFSVNTGPLKWCWPVVCLASSTLPLAQVILLTLLIGTKTAG